ncbi:MAG: alpha-amylase family glycosyl hydrolase [Anaerolineales bacterium]|jgi:alpha-glucosidase
MSESSESLPWWKRGVIYQIYTRSFADSNGDGIGDLGGILAHLDYLNDGTPASLGVDAIWLSPIFASPAFDFGYDVSDYCAIDPIFGRLADLDELIAQAHQRGIRVILDLALNHTSHLHPWFLESRASRSSSKRDWYLWQDPRPQGGPPNRWQSVFGGRAWQWDPATRQYYYHMFLPQQPDLNWRNPQVREEIDRIMRFWLERGVDGFRLDVVNAYFKDLELRDNPFRWGLRAYDRQAHVYDADRPELLPAYTAFRRLVDRYGDRMVVGEPLMGNPQVLQQYCRPDRLHLAFDFDLISCRWNPRAFQRTILACEQAFGPEGWPCYALGNHDVSRLVSRYPGPHAPERAKVAAALLLTLHGTPSLYQGEEIGMRDSPVPRRRILDPAGKRYWPLYRGRDPVRTPLPWNDGVGAGFSNGRPWLPINPDFRSVNVARESEDPGSVLSFYRRLIWLRRGSRALNSGSFQTLLRNPDSGLAYLRQSQEEIMLVALNFRGHPAQIVLDEDPSTHEWEWRLGTHPGSHGPLVGRRLNLQPYEVCIFQATR